jgi:spore coat polysaccharide biosynthesis protein SpsF (cytidylyltransferase family)
VAAREEVIWTVIQARLGSRRFPRKVLAPFGDGLLIDAVHERAVQLGPSVAWAIPREDKDLARSLIGRGWLYTEGPEDDVLTRYLEAAQQLGADHVVRVTADCPFLDVEAGRWTIQEHLDSGADFTTFQAEGRAVEVFTRGLLERLDRLAHGERDREHVDEYVLAHPSRFNIRFVKFSVDTPAELERARERTKE